MPTRPKSCFTDSHRSNASANERARLTLTKAITRYRLGDYSIPSDSLLTEAINLFEAKGDNHRLMQGLFLRADLLLTTQQYSEAMKNALNEYNLATLDTISYWRAKTSEQVSDIFALTNNFEKSIPYSKEAIDYFQQSNHYINSLYAFCDLAVAYNAIGLTKQSIQILDSIGKIAQDSLLDNHLIVYSLKNQENFWANNLAV